MARNRADRECIIRLVLEDLVRTVSASLDADWKSDHDALKRDLMAAMDKAVAALSLQ